VTWLSAAFGFGKAVAEAADVPDDVDQARAIHSLSVELGKVCRKLSKAGLSPPARIVLEGRAFGCRASLVRLGVAEANIQRIPRPPPA